MKTYKISVNYSQPNVTVKADFHTVDKHRVLWLMKHGQGFMGVSKDVASFNEWSYFIIEEK